MFIGGRSLNQAKAEKSYVLCRSENKIPFRGCLVQKVASQDDLSTSCLPEVKVNVKRKVSQVI